MIPAGAGLEPLDSADSGRLHFLRLRCLSPPVSALRPGSPGASPRPPSQGAFPGECRSGPDKRALFSALLCPVRDGSPRSVAGRERVGRVLTRQDERRRTAADERSAFAKVGVAGSNPVVRSRPEALSVVQGFTLGHALGHSRLCPCGRREPCPVQSLSSKVHLFTLTLWRGTQGLLARGVGAASVALDARMGGTLKEAVPNRTVWL